MSEPDRSFRGPTRRRAIVIGGGTSGMLAAAALREHADHITVVERDSLPQESAPRKGLPQAHHAHLLWSGGARAMEELLPGVTARWLAAGARRIALPTGLVSMQSQGWLRRWPETQFVIACSRDLLDWVIRERATADPRIEVLSRTELLRLEGSSARVTGVRVRTHDGEERVLTADLVVDASGRGSRAPRWLGALGVAAPRHEEVDSGLAYASRVFRAPDGTEDFPLVNVQSDARQSVPGRTTTIVPIEDGRWLVTLSGTRGGQPGGSADEFESFARSVRHPVVGELINGLEALSDVVVTRSTVNRRNYFEKVRSWPEGFVVLGDAVATYNPVYGHGLSVAAQGAVALRDNLVGHGLTAPRLAAKVQRAVARPVSLAWELAVGQDIQYPGAVGKQPGGAARLLRRYVDRLLLTSTGHPAVTKALFDVMTLSGPRTALVRPRIVLAVLRGPTLPQLTAPPLTDRELALAQSPQKTP
ncbi:FAD-dependent oxidoreductase [Streptomyces sp. NPDC056132]|uniref:FAD-dependent oxidoreductase n=1 Tax=Streptomyces sp. NPDC056132 TaxID=3345722 RepID=UPI0035DE7F8C